MTKDEALRLALDALEAATRHFTRTPSTLADSTARGAAHAAIEACRAALAAPAAVPVALWQYRWTNPGDHPHPDANDLAWKEVRVREGSMQTMEQRINELRAYRYNDRPSYEVRALYAGAAPAAPSVPPGWKLVPVEWTEEMLVAALTECEPLGSLINWREGFGRRSMQATWAAALAAAPTDAEQAAEAPARVELTDAARDVLAERQRQVSVEGWTPEHDDEHRTGGMAVAAACYAAWSMPSRPASEVVAVMWPWTGWSHQWFKPKDTRHNLIRAGALLLAEIERLDRAAGIQSGTDGGQAHG